MLCRSLFISLSLLLPVLRFTLLITSLVSLIYGFWSPLWYLWFTASDYPFGIFDLRLLITTLVSLIYGFWSPLWYLRFTASDYHFGIFDLRLLITTLVSSNILTPLKSSNTSNWTKLSGIGYLHILLSLKFSSFHI